jgi:hypothetical protein
MGKAPAVVPDDNHAHLAAPSLSPREVIANGLKPILRRITKAHPDDFRLPAVAASAVGGTIAVLSWLRRLSRDADAHARQVHQLWAETDDVRTKLVDLGEDFVDALSSPPPSGGDEL